MKSATGADRNETIKAIADSMRNQIVKGWKTREIKTYARQVAKGTGHDLYIDGIFEAVKEGRI